MNEITPDGIGSIHRRVMDASRERARAIAIRLDALDLYSRTIENMLRSVRNDPFSPWRFGQALMNLLRDSAPEIYGRITGEDFDPFYRDDKMEACLDWLEAHRDELATFAP